MPNPLSTPLTSIVLVSDKDEEFNVEVFLRNNFCQFERMELEESVNNIFPIGSIIVRDLGDIVTYIAQNEIKKIKVSLNNGEIFTWYITSITYTNNMASETDQTYVVLYFTNKLFYESQQVSFYDERAFINEGGEEEEGTVVPIWLTPYPFVTTPEHIIQTYGKKRVFSAPEYDTTGNGNEVNVNTGCGVNLFIKNTQPVTNYVLFRPRIADAVRREQFQTNIINYLNYIFTYAVNSDDKPYYLFWTDFTNCLNYKFFDLKKDLEGDEFKFDLPNTDKGQIQAYAIYDSHDVTRTFKIEDEDVLCKKIYVLVTNPAYSLSDKNYYYLRSSPLYMEDTEEIPGGTYSDVTHLMSPFLSEASNTTLSTVTSYTVNSSPGLTYAQRTYSVGNKDKNLVFLQDKGFNGYTKDYTDARFNINTVDAVSSYENLINHIETTPLSLRDTFDPNAPQPPAYPYNDNLYMWQYQFDITNNHPNRKTVTTETPPNSGNQVSSLKGVDFYQEVLDIINQANSGDQSGSDVSDFAIFSILDEVTMNKVLKAKYDAMKEQNVYDNERRELLIKTEKENFIANVLCCIGKDLGNKEDWFFAQITGYAQDQRKIVNSNGGVIVEKLNDAWLYSWKQLQPGPIIAGLTAGNTAYIGIHAANHNMFHGWTASQCIGSTGMPTETDIDKLQLGIGFTGIETWAINLNERFNGLEPTSSGMVNYRGPGYNASNFTEIGSFSVKPVGFTGALYENQKIGGGKHIVKMHKISINELREMGAAVAAPNLGNEYVYYFIAENAVDGACNV